MSGRGFSASVFEFIRLDYNMCGIAGIVLRDGRKPDLRLVKKMTNMLVHRGPDGAGHIALEGCALGHRRLSIIDLEAGAQPMTNEDESVWITYNGEVYNFLELRDQLEGKGHTFRTRSDTETIVHLYEDFGEKVVDHLRGMFAFGIWNRRNRQLLLARDRIGKKPLFWFEDKEGIYFASEIKALLVLPNCPFEVDYESIDLYLAYQSIPGTKTIFSGIHRLAPASRLVWTPQSSAFIEKYWSLDWTKKTSLSYMDAKEHLRDLIREATRCRMIADVPLGAFLSGGVDSSLVVSAMAEVSDRPVKTFTIGFPQKDYTETQYARIVADKFETEHEELIVEPSGIEIISKLVWHYDQPFADSSAIPTYMVSKIARQHVKVALTGDGGDEFFGGYEYYRAGLYQRLFSRVTPRALRGLMANFVSGISEGANKRSVPGKLIRFIKASQFSPELSHLQLTQMFNRQVREKLYEPEFYSHLNGYQADDYLLNLIVGSKEKSAARGDEIDPILRADTLMYLPDTLLTKVDIASMAVSLEGRSPLLDTSVMEFAASLPSGWKVRLFDSKQILKEAYEGILPNKILYRQKMGFKVPLTHWFRSELYDYVAEVLLDKQAIDRGYFNSSFIQELIEDHKHGRKDNSARLWALLMLELWHHEFPSDLHHKSDADLLSV